ncbi:MAG TPA: choice-of-anchor tandem repeat GloVer-containing protein [Verrucomicrobiae bacterium]|nr:choice-of-anchor tandem repeat GloVer-containing protein [Verrucomicrobiae bacterium]
MGQTTLINSNAVWNVTDITDPSSQVYIGQLQAPFSSYGYGDTPIANTWWHATNVPNTQMYGTSTNGGTANLGTVYAFNTSGFVTATLHNFTGKPDGALPNARLSISGSAWYGTPEVLYGTTSRGGANDLGTLFKINAVGTGYQIIRSFSSSDGSPLGGLVVTKNAIYGTTANQVYKIAISGTNYTFSRLATVSNPTGLVYDPTNSTLYGITAASPGTVFKLPIAGGFSTLHTFGGSVPDAAQGGASEPDGTVPEGGISLGADGLLYGTTTQGGFNSVGTVFSLRTTSTGGTGYQTVFDFNSTIGTPCSRLLSTIGGVLFGTTTNATGGVNMLYSIQTGGSGFQNVQIPSTMGTPAIGDLVLNDIDPGGVLGTFFGATGVGVLYSFTLPAFSSFNSFSLSSGTFQNIGLSLGPTGGKLGAGVVQPVVDYAGTFWLVDGTFNLTAGAASSVQCQVAIDNDATIFVNGQLITHLDLSGAATWSPVTLANLRTGSNDIMAVINGDAGGDSGSLDLLDYFDMSISGSDFVTTVFRSSDGLSGPTGIAYSRGALWIANTASGNLLDGTPGGSLSALTGFSFLTPVGVYADLNGYIYVADAEYGDLLEFQNSLGNPPLSLTLTNVPTFPAQSLTVDNAGNLYYIIEYENKLVEVPPVIPTQCCGGPYLVTPLSQIGGGGSLVLSTNLTTGISGQNIFPSAAPDNQGNVYIADMVANVVRKANLSTGIITTFAGNGTPGWSGDGGLATDAQLFNPSAVAVDVYGNVYISDTSNQVIRRVDVHGIITTIAGIPGSPGFVDGDPSVAQFNFPSGLAFDPSGNLYISDTGNSAIRQMTPPAN